MTRPVITYQDIQTVNLFFNTNENTAKLLQMIEQVDQNFNNAETSAAKFNWSKIKGRLLSVVDAANDVIKFTDNQLKLIKQTSRVQ